MDADIDPSFAADRKSTVDAEQTFVAGASGYFVRYAAFYALHRDIDRTTDRFDRTAFALLFFLGIIVLLYLLWVTLAKRWYIRRYHELL